ncbi:EamA family transporter [Pseudochrobactrum sp. sp1633]|uniref:DMT family transporter n=1 Tax=Pseudochrobactrum sp. sp1633 TaxID=3036706 RepID=UPI0025A6036A|nr:EamA family transporter [Pseudochrobactrum sp. sp1633]MDM8347249.1 EamA family transporter [Pseudochrobactrum sp. sp1633]HWD13354.1 EamA family transporter [Pseudochrobactrum sp.]
MSDTSAIRTDGAGLGILCVLIASFLWGTTGTVATFAPEVGPLAIGAVAMGLGGILQALLALRALKRDGTMLRQYWPVVLFGALSVAAYPLAFYSSMYLAGVTVGTVVTIGSAPLFSALTEWVFDRKTLSKQWLAGSVAGLAGIVLLCFFGEEQKAAQVVSSSWEVTAGVVLGLIGGLTYALYTWAAHRLMRKGISSKAAMGAIFGIGGILLMPVLLATGGALLSSWNNALVGAYMAVIPMFTGYVLFGYALARISVSTATTITLIEPVIAALLAVVIVGETLSALGWLGAVLVISCLVILSAPQNTFSRKQRR